jgi:hypothetical protein
VPRAGLYQALDHRTEERAGAGGRFDGQGARKIAFRPETGNIEE